MTAPAIARIVLVGEVNGREKKKINDKKLAEFFVGDLRLKVSAWEDLAPQVPEDGTTVVVEGKVRSRKYERDGQDRYATEVIASSIFATDAVGPVEEKKVEDPGF